MESSNKSFNHVLFACIATLFSQSVCADEGQWLPHQLPQLKTQLSRIGINVPAERFANLSLHPMSAIVSLGGCSASFVSPHGLIVTNHHCAYGAIQKNSTAENNLLDKGFLAKTMADELPAGPGNQIYVTDSVEDVTRLVHQGINDAMSGKEREKTVANNIKKLIAECEQDKTYRCSIPSFHRGLEYYRIRQLMIRDVRIVYAPSEHIGNFGGEIDNFEWPRHTGDFAFLRAYVGKDGKPAAYHKDNVPYKSRDFLEVDSRGIKDGDPILLAGYPGRTSRYKTAAEIRFARDVDFPARLAETQSDLQVIAKETANSASDKVTYASVVKSINNGYKKTQGLYDGFMRKDIAAIKERQDSEFERYLSTNPNAKELLSQQKTWLEHDMRLSREEFLFDSATNSALLRAVLNLYRFAIEREKPDAERERGFQERDRDAITSRIANLKTSVVPRVDAARMKASLGRLSKLEAQDLSAGLKTLLPSENSVEGLILKSEFTDPEKRLAWITRSADEFRRSNDPLIQLAVKLFPVQLELNERKKEVAGQLEKILPQVMQARISWYKEQGKPIYPDANSTLRVTYGTVSPYSPKDGIVKGPFTRLAGVAEKHTGKLPFKVPANLLEAINAGKGRDLVEKTIGDIPVNFLSSADTTGGNSGSAVMNKDARLIGLNFDSTYESITKDWYFDPQITRAIHVDIRYVLWIMREVDGAHNVLKEMTIK